MPRNDKQILDWFEDAAEFEALLLAAEREASTPFETDFTTDWREKFKRWGEKAYMSEKQADTMQRIAGKGIR